VSAQVPLVKDRIKDAISSEPKLAKLFPATKHILEKQGKYLRPALVLLSCGLCGEEPEVAVEYAAVMELLHVGSLVFDDLLDGLYDEEYDRDLESIPFPNHQLMSHEKNT